MIKYAGFGHLSIVVQDIGRSTDFYCTHLGAVALQEFPHFSMKPFTENTGLTSYEQDVDITARFLMIPPINLYFELITFHYPKPEKTIEHDKFNDFGCVNHISFRVKNIDEVFDHFKQVPEVTLLNTAPDYRPRQLYPITPEQFTFNSALLENNAQEKQKVCAIVETIRFFLIRDFNGIHWEFEQGHDDIGS